MKKIQCIQLFETYGEAYQPYIPPVIEALKNCNKLELIVLAYKGKASKYFQVIPSYKKRRIIERLHGLLDRKNNKLNYIEALSLNKNVDIVHIQQSYLFSKVIRLLEIPKHKRPKIVITLRGGDTYVKPWFMPRWEDFYANYGNKIDAFVVMSQHQKKYLHTKWHIDLVRIHVIPISFGHAFKPVLKNLNKAEMKIVSAFRMCWEKNIEGNLRVIKHLKDRKIPVKYDLYGDGPDSGQVYYLIDKYQLGDIVNFHGRISNKNLKNILGSYDFFLQLSHSESLGMSVIEAQALGLPAIVSNSDGLPEVVLNEITGYCIPPHESEFAADCLERLWRNNELYAEFSKAAIHYSHNHFSIKQEINKLELLYKTLKQY